MGIVSDTHAFLDPRVADLIRGCDLAVHAGDVCSAGVLDALRPKTRITFAVAGNNDSAERLPAPQAYLARRLPREIHLRLPGGTLAVEHGDRHGFDRPCHRSLRRLHREARALVYGHTHRAVLDQSETPWVINPGAAGKVRTHGGPSCAVLVATRRCWWVRLIRFRGTDRGERRRDRTDVTPPRRWRYQAPPRFGSSTACRGG
ncbi:MAG: metallophosphatase family protein [Gammaproteobacteria bacterium]|nr:metallophosphatase family protein [Gammaproteobacteria bacterium]